jgi:drug/metabolite transporter (DMT)-like permease
MLALGIICAIGASALYNTSVALQALEAREVGQEHALRVSLIGRLVRNPRWLLATFVGLLGWPLEIAALLMAPLTVVQPCLASGLVLLLWLGVHKLGERPGRREYGSVALIVLGVAGVAWAAPERTTSNAGAVPIAIALGLVAIPILAPYVVRRRAGAAGTLAIVAAGFGYAWTAIASKLLTDEVSDGSLIVAAIWLATAAASEGLALLSEMSALGRRPATQVTPVMFAVQVVVPVILAPLIFGESWSGTPGGGAALVLAVLLAIAGVVLLAGSRAVGAVIETAHAEEIEAAHAEESGAKNGAETESASAGP